MGNIEKKFGLKAGQAIALFAILLLNVAWIVCCFVENKDNLQSLVLLPFLMFVVTVYYAYCGYKKPHGNHIRYLLLCSCAFSAFQYPYAGFKFPTYIAILTYVIVILKAYMAGRLDHYKQNVIISAAVLVCQCLVSYHFINEFVSFGNKLSFVSFMARIGTVTLWLAIAASYIVRYKPHKEAGLED